MTHVLRAVRASFLRDGVELAAPFELVLDAGRRADIEQPSKVQASIAARLCSGIIKPSTGAVYIMDYDSRLQPSQAKRWVGFVEADGFAGDARDFARRIALQAAVWSVDPKHAWTRAAAALAAFDDDRDAYVRAVALALVPDIALLVLDRPLAGVVDKVAGLRPSVTIVATRVEAFQPALPSPQEGIPMPSRR